MLVDSAFPRQYKDLSGNLVRVSKENEQSDLAGGAAMAELDILLERAMTRDIISGEWSVRALKGRFKRFCVTLLGDSYKRYRLLRICIHIYNFRVRKVGLNQLHTVYEDSGSVVQP